MAETRFDPAPRGDLVPGLLFGLLGLGLMWPCVEILRTVRPHEYYVALYPGLAGLALIALGFWIARRGISLRARMILKQDGLTLWRLRNGRADEPIVLQWSEIAAVHYKHVQYTSLMGFELTPAGALRLGKIQPTTRMSGVLLRPRPTIWLYSHAFDAPPHAVLAALEKSLSDAGYGVERKKFFNGISYGARLISTPRDTLR